jgi:transposase-like protein
MRPVVSAWNARSLQDERYPFVIVDAMVLKILEEGQVRARGDLLAIGVNEEGYREVLGFMLGDSKLEDSWSKFFSRLKTRCVHFQGR